MTYAYMNCGGTPVWNFAPQPGKTYVPGNYTIFILCLSSNIHLPLWRPAVFCAAFHYRRVILNDSCISCFLKSPWRYLEFHRNGFLEPLNLLSSVFLKIKGVLPNSKQNWMIFYLFFIFLQIAFCLGSVWALADSWINYNILPRAIVPSKHDQTCKWSFCLPSYNLS